MAGTPRGRPGRAATFAVIILRDVLGSHAEGPVSTGERGTGYYLSAVEKGGEPAGIWIGNGAAGLGSSDGSVVRREDFEPLYGQFLDPREPSGRTYLGSPPRVNTELASIYQAKLAAHPGATADERMRLLAEARAEYTGPVGVQYFDTTCSVEKTISLAHASALASAILQGRHFDDGPTGFEEAVLPMLISRKSRLRWSAGMWPGQTGCPRQCPASRH